MTAPAEQSEPLAEQARSPLSQPRHTWNAIPVFLAPALLIYAGFIVYPVLRTFYNSMHVIKPRNVTEFVGFANFAALLKTDPVFWKAVGNTAIFALVGTIADVAGGLLLALCLFVRVPLARVWRVVWFTPVLMSYVVVGIIWVWIYDYDWGVVNIILHWLGLGAFEHSWLRIWHRRDTSLRSRERRH